MLYDTGKMLISTSSTSTSESYSGLVLPPACFKDTASIDEIAQFLDEMKKLFHTHQESDIRSLFTEVEKFMDNTSILDGSEYHVGELKKALVFSFCYFTVQADLKIQNFFHVSHQSCQFLFPLDPERPHMLTEGYFKKLKEAQFIVTKAAVDFYVR